MSADEILRMVGQVGVPAVLAGFVLVRLDASVRAMELAIRELIAKIDRVIDRQGNP